MVLVIGTFHKWRGSKCRIRLLWMVGLVEVDDLVVGGGPMVVVWQATWKWRIWNWWLSIVVFVTSSHVVVYCAPYVCDRMLRRNVDGELPGRW